MPFLQTIPRWVEAGNYRKIFYFAFLAVLCHLRPESGLLGPARWPEPWEPCDHPSGPASAGFFSLGGSRKLSQNFYFAFLAVFGPFEARIWPLGHGKVAGAVGALQPPIRARLGGFFSLGGSRKLSQNFYFAFLAVFGAFEARMWPFEAGTGMTYQRLGSRMCRLPTCRGKTRGDVPHIGKAVPETLAATNLARPFRV